MAPGGRPEAERRRPEDRSGISASSLTKALLTTVELYPKRSGGHEVFAGKTLGGAGWNYCGLGTQVGAPPTLMPRQPPASSWCAGSTPFSSRGIGTIRPCSQMESGATHRRLALNADPARAQSQSLRQ